MWTSPEDVERYRELTHEIRASLDARPGQRRLEVVEPGDLAAFLEWMELAREAAPSLLPFIDKSSPFGLNTLTYEDLARDFSWLRTYVTVASEEAYAED